MLTAGWHAIRYDMHETTSSASAHLSWSGPAIPKQIISEQYLAPGLSSLPGNYGADDDFHLLSGSPAIDAGSLASYYLGEQSPSGDRVEIGAYGNSGEAFLSPPQMVQVLSPNGLEKYEQGQQVEIDWRSAGLMQQRPVALINSGSTTAVDNFLGDAFSFGGTYTGSITNAINLSGVANPAPMSVYQSYRYTDSNTPGDGFGYQLAVPDGTYTITLHFEDPSYYGVGQRKFDIKLQNVLVQDEYDVFAAAGGQYKAASLTFTVTASGGNGIKLEFLNGSTGLYNNTAFVCGIELWQANPGGVANPTVNLELSSDGGVNWSPLANNLTMDRFGRGAYLWTIPDSTDRRQPVPHSRRGQRIRGRQRRLRR